VTVVKGSDVITLRGAPRRLVAVVPFATPSQSLLRVTLELPGEVAVLRAVIAPFGRETSEIRLQLPRETPPGTYRGKATVGEKTRHLLVEVEPVLHLRVQPGRTVLAAEPGGRAEIRVTVLNAGNTAFEVERVIELELEDGEGQDRALGRALRADLTEGETRVDRFFEELREGYGGVARLAVTQGDGVLEPGRSCELVALLDIPVTVQARHAYSGTWQLGDAAHLIDVEVTKGAPEPARRGRRKA
jgi:hypothetical protein